MADILFSHSYFLRFDPKQWETMQPYPPLGTLYAASYTRQRGYSVALFDSMLAAGPDEFRAALDAHQPRFVVLYEDSFNYLSKMCLTRMREAAFVMAGLAKRQGGCTVIVSGSDATDHKAAYLAHGADYLLIGEGEITLVALLDVLSGRSRTSLDDVPGLAFIRDGTLRQTGERELLRDLDVLPPPARDLLDIPLYERAWRTRHGYFSMNVVTTRGCPFKCNWCAKPIYGNRYNSRSPERVAAELRELKTTCRPDHLWFADDIFGLKPGWVERFSRCVIEQDAVIPFKIQARVDLLDEDVVRALKTAGCRSIWVGAESGSQKILDAMDKGTTVEQIHTAAARLHRHGIEVGFFLQFGYPGETWEDIGKTMLMVRDCRPDDIGISVSYPLPGTMFYERVRQELGEKRNWTDSDDLAMMFRGTYSPEFYRTLHRVVHGRFRVQKGLDAFAEWLRHPARLDGQRMRTVAAAASGAAMAAVGGVRLRRLRH
ncbi:MAG: B12-binding domain-containing radical SAM protein [Candidatus Latescibacteria bacterium]|nr:B12-binding domain-containing radical SAM protein [Candidatus Latescibacterota bacterium]